MSRRANGAVRCPRCRMLGSLCVCAFIPDPPLATRTRVVLVIHRAEDRKSTNTGRIALACLANSEAIVRGHIERPTPPLRAADGTKPILLFPHEDAVPIEDFAGEAVTLVVPDGNWRQASRMRRRVPALDTVPCVRLAGDERSPHRLRAEAHAHGLATIEAIARALGVLEGPHVREALERVFRAMAERTLWTRGELDDDDVTTGLPEGALRHDPRSGLARTLRG